MQLSVACILDHANLDPIGPVLVQLYLNLIVWTLLYFLAGQVFLCVRHFSIVGEENDASLLCTAFRVEEHVGEEDRVVIDISATKVGHPADVVQSRDKQSLILHILELVSDLGLLFERGLACKLDVKNGHWIAWARRSFLTPDNIDEVWNGLEHDIRLFQALNLHL